MNKMIETLKNNGWEMSTFGQCQLGDEVLTRRDKKASVYTTVCGKYEREGLTVTEDGIFPDWTPVLRSPRPEYAPGTVALIRRSEDQPPVRAWKIREHWLVQGGSPVDDDDDRIEVIRVLLPADQDTPPVEVTDEMVERAAEAMYRQECDFGWDEDAWEDEKDEFREEARRILEAALRVEK